MLKKIAVSFLFLVGLTLSSCRIARAQENSKVDYLQAKVTQATDIGPQKGGEDNSFNDWQKIKVKLTDKVHKNEEVEFENQSSIIEKNDRKLGVGDAVIVSYQVVNNDKKVALVDFDRSGQLMFMGIFVVVMLIIIGKWIGLRALVSFAWIGSVLVGILIPKLLAGTNVYWLTFVCVILLAVGTSVIVLGWTWRAFLVVCSTLFGLSVAALLMFIVGWWSRFSPIGQEELVMFRLSPVLSKLNLLSIIYASIIIGAVGSMMDMSISIVAGIEELIETNREKGVRKISQQELFQSGINIGRSVMAAETNTMFLAYFGSALIIWVIAVSQNYQWNLLISFSMIFGELLRILSGAVGIFSSIPMTAFLASRLLQYKRKFIFGKEINE